LTSFCRPSQRPIHLLLAICGSNLCFSHSGTNSSSSGKNGMRWSTAPTPQNRRSAAKPGSFATFTSSTLYDRRSSLVISSFSSHLLQPTTQRSISLCNLMALRLFKIGSICTALYSSRANATRFMHPPEVLVHSLTISTFLRKPCPVNPVLPITEHRLPYVVGLAQYAASPLVNGPGSLLPDPALLPHARSHQTLTLGHGFHLTSPGLNPISLSTLHHCPNERR
jgi:uncharacterized membrane protein (DUF485 family)